MAHYLNDIERELEHLREEVPRLRLVLEEVKALAQNVAADEHRMSEDPRWQGRDAEQAVAAILERIERFERENE